MLTLIQFHPDDHQKPQTFRLADGRAHRLGRGHGEVQLKDSRISREHAEISVQNGTWVIRDLGSSNGTWVNGERITGLCELEEGDRLVVGRLTLIVGHVEVSDAATKTAPPPSPTPGTGGAATAALHAEPMDLGASSLDDFDLDAELDLEPIDFESDASANAEAVSASDIDIDVDAGDDLLNLDDDLDDASAEPGPGASSLAPALSGQPQAAVEPDPPAAGEEEEDEYAASMDFVAPRSRPNSPLDSAADDSSTTPRPVGETADDEDEDDDDLVVAENAEDDDTGDAPAVVGLSLDLPAPDADAEDDLSSLSGELGSVDDWSDLEDELEAEAVVSQTPTDDTHTRDEAITTEKHDSASPSPLPAASHYEDQASAPAEPDWAEPEAQREIDGAWASQGTSRGKKGLAVLVILALVGGIAFWALNSSETNTPVAGSPSAPPDDNSAESLAYAPDANTADSPSAAPTAPATPSNPVPLAPVPTPTDPADSPDNPASPIAPPSNAFGQAPTLTAPVPAPANPSAPAPETAPPTRVAPDAPSADVPPALAAAEPDTPAPDPSLDTPAASNPDAGEALAMLDPAPTSSPLLNLPADRGSDRPIDAPQAVPADAGRRIAFVVDASGSMVDSLNQGALTWLEERLGTLTDRDQFTVLFFRSNEVVEVPPAGFKTADSLTRERVLAWASPTAGNIRPRGKSEPITALQVANGYQPTDIYILSDDKFGQRRAAAALDASELAGLLGDHPAVVHTVQFFYDNQDDPRLKGIAQRFGGTYEFVKEPPFDLEANQNLGVDLLGISR